MKGGFDFDDPFKDSETVSTKSTMQSTESSRSSRREAPSRGLQRKSSNRKLRSSREMHRQDRAQQQQNHQPEEEAFDAFGFSQDSAFSDPAFEVQPQGSSANQRPAARSTRTRRRASLAAAPSSGTRQPPSQSHSFDGSDLPSSRRNEPSNPRPNTRRSRRASLAAPPQQPKQTDYGYGDDGPAMDYGYGGGDDHHSHDNEFGYEDGAPSSAAAPVQERPRRSGRRSSISGGLDGLKSDLKSGGPDPFSSISSGGSNELKPSTSSNRALGGATRAHNIVVPMTAAEKSGRRSGRRGSLLGTVGDAMAGAVGATVGGFANAIGKEKLEENDTPKQKSFLRDRGITRTNSSDNGIISSYTGDPDRVRRSRRPSMGRNGTSTSYSDRIMAKK